MRTWLRPCAFVVAALFTASSPAGVCAQGFFQNLFGGGASPPPPPPQQRMQIPSYSYRTPIDLPQRHDRDRDRSDDNESRSGHYRTLCVRMCDGYYWPISQSATRSRFYRDANVCKSTCGEDARLFYLPSSQADTKEMVDLNGRAYSKLASAYLYRKRMIDGCKCKPDPWAQSERDRHALYAETERHEKERLAVANALQNNSTGQSKSDRVAELATAKPRTGQVAAEVSAAIESTVADTPDVPATVVESARDEAELSNPAPLDENRSKPEPQGAALPPQRTRTARREAAERQRHAQTSPARMGSSVARAPQRVAQKGSIGGTAPYGLGAAKSRWPGD